MEIPFIQNGMKECTRHSDGGGRFALVQVGYWRKDVRHHVLVTQSASARVRPMEVPLVFKAVGRRVQRILANLRSTVGVRAIMQSFLT